jgi:branched-subunit amino acid transport protein
LTAAWTAILVAAIGCYGLKLAGVSLPDSVLNHRHVQRSAGLLPVAMLAALAVTDLFDANGRYVTDWPALAGVGSGAVALRLRQSLVVVFLVAIVVAATVRAAIKAS